MRRADGVERARRTVLVRGCRRVVVFVCGRARVSARVMRGAWRSSRAHSMRASQAAYGGMRDVVCSGRAGDRDRSARVPS